MYLYYCILENFGTSAISRHLKKTSPESGWGDFWEIGDVVAVRNLLFSDVHLTWREVSLGQGEQKLQFVLWKDSKKLWFVCELKWITSGRVSSQWTGEGEGEWWEGGEVLIMFFIMLFCMLEMAKKIKKCH